jgi:hypothetical protein
MLLFVYVVFAFHQVVETSISKVSPQIIDQAEKTFAIDYLANIAPRNIDTVVRDSILDASALVLTSPKPVLT